MKQPIIAALDDLFFTAKIRATAEHLGADVRFTRSAQATIDAVRGLRPALIIVDLHAQKCEPFALARTLKQDDQLRGVTLLGFFSHVQTKLMEQAKEAGYDHVLPRSAFTHKLAEILEGKVEKQL